jgi:hypothetical protein
MTSRGQQRPERVDQSRLADARDPGDTDPQRPAGVRQQTQQQLLGVTTVIGTGGLDQRDRAGELGP